ncbi:MAG: pyrroline-5-carboxylate reductase [bacterium]|nr:pyrroline-5-carboxylate reductase [bacterium]
MELKGKKLVFVGAGNMAEALVRGILKVDLIGKENLLVTDVNPKRLEFFDKALGVKGISDNKQAVLLSDIIILSVKPQMMANILGEISGVVQPGQKVISIAAGITTEFIESKLAKEIPVIRVMPNTPALIGHGMAGICAGKYAQDEDMELVGVIFEAVGKVVVVKEEQMDAVTALSGCGPAYIFTIVEVLTAAGISLGLPEEISLPLAIETVEGAAKMLKETNEGPSILRNKVTSPGGATMAALNVLEEKGFREIFIQAVTVAAKRSKELSIIN